MAKTRSSAPEALERSAVYALLSRTYLREPDRHLIQYFRSEVVQSILAELELSLGETFLSDAEDLLVEELALEYASLFLSPPSHLPPYESFFVGGLHDAEEAFEPALQGKAAVEVLSFYLEHGIILPDKTPLLPDHIGVELEALRLLCELEAGAIAKAREDLAQRYRCIAGQFLTEHPKRWINAFCEGILQRTRSPFYRAVAQLTQAFVRSELEELTHGGVEMEEVSQ